MTIPTTPDAAPRRADDAGTVRDAMVERAMRAVYPPLPSAVEADWKRDITRALDAALAGRLVLDAEDVADLAWLLDRAAHPVSYRTFVEAARIDRLRARLGGDSHG